jgi:non-specific serine/threonine protein kinase
MHHASCITPRQSPAAALLALAERARPKLRGSGQAAWMDRLATEIDNLRAALGWAFDADEVELGLRLAGAVERFWQYRGYLGEGRRWLERGLAIDRPVAPAARAAALSMAGWLARFQDEVERAETFLTESLALYRELGDEEGYADALDSLGDVAHFRGEQEQAQALHEENLARRRARGDRWGVAMTLNSLGWVALARGDHDRAEELLEESLGIVRALGDRRGIVIVLLSQSWVALSRDDAERAAPMLAESLTLAHRLGNVIDSALCLFGLAAVAGMRGQPERAARLAGAFEGLLERHNLTPGATIRAYHEPHLAAARACLTPDAWAAAEAAGRAMTLDEAMRAALGDV